ncbi:hypothetical protein BJ138DRAFT_491805 [Hygrophoropsis aurantiaca]|uniref:Uncharacterized protein n=1 Tax=Hygrophoropsis aurantiaca TaxID=72124 RepID=A0ACB8AL27_9AGAM|nr:hypothetical protein BJ138DRAFT_491805 [Hygrophoropsis aurantiaca]
MNFIVDREDVLPPNSQIIGELASFFSTSSSSSFSSTVVSTSSSLLSSTAQSTSSLLSQSPSPAVDRDTSSSHSSNVGLIAGVAAGCVGVIALLILILCLRNRWRKKANALKAKNILADPSPSPTPEFNQNITSPTQSPLLRKENKDPKDKRNLNNLQASPADTGDHLPPPSMSEAQGSRPSLEHHSPPPTRQMYDRWLTDEQADFITELQEGNVPTPTILHIMERMLARQESGLENNVRQGSVTELTRGMSMMSSPPGYE